MKLPKFIMFFFDHPRKNYFLPTLTVSLIFFGVLLFSIPTLVLLHSNLAFQTTGQVGDTIGGTTAPFIGFAGIIITFLAFYVQFPGQRKPAK